MNIREHPFLYQWDTNRYLDIPEADAVYVDFARTGEEPLRIAVADGGVRIPDSWLQTAGNKNIYVCYVDGTLRGYTLRIVPRPKPSDYVATPDEAQSYAKLEKKVSDEVSRLDDRINNIPEGKDGITPTIGDNGNWYLGDTDTGKPSRGITGEPAKDGHSPVVTATKSGKTTTISVDGTAIATVEDGADGKSAYQYAVDGGYTGTEEEFAAKMAAEIPAVDATLTQSGQAADAKETGDAIRSLSEEMLTEESDPTVPAWAKAAQKPSYTASEVGADPSGTAASRVSAHNTGTDTHSDIRLLISGLTDRLNALSDSDDTTLDQLSEVVAYIKSNRSLIEAITTSKVSVADIIDNLTTNVANKPLSAAQGVVIKTLIDALRNDKLDAAELNNAVNTALAQAKASGEFDGADGKSAYQYAVEGGYTKTEAEFAEKMAQEQLTGTTNDLTPKQVYQAVSVGIPVKVQYTDPTFGLSSFTAFNVSESMNVIASNAIINYYDTYLLAALYGNKSNNVWFYEVTPLAKPSDIPSALPNPNALKFTGAVTGSYDGSAPMSVKIPSAVTDDHINSLIDTKLGVIENGAY